MPDANLAAALEQINEIHGHMARGQVYRGYRPLPVVVSGAVGLLAAWLQPAFVPTGDPRQFVYYWLGVAGLSALIAASAVAVHFLRQGSYERRQTLFVWGQFVPCVAAGGMIGAGVATALPAAVGLLPGLWAIIFSLGIFSSRPFLPRATGWVALYYLAGGAWLLLHPLNTAEPAWPLALLFFIGQCAGALILYLKLERTPCFVKEIDF